LSFTSAPIAEYVYRRQDECKRFIYKISSSMLKRTKKILFPNVGKATNVR